MSFGYTFLNQTDHIMTSSNVTMLNWKTFRNIWWHLDLVTFHDKTCHLSWYIITYHDNMQRSCGDIITTHQFWKPYTSNDSLCRNLASCGQISCAYLQYLLRYELTSSLNFCHRRTESDAYEPIMQVSQVGSINALFKGIQCWLYDWDYLHSSKKRNSPPVKMCFKIVRGINDGPFFRTDF